MIRKIADEDPDESNDKDKKGMVSLMSQSCSNFQKIFFSQKQFAFKF